MVNGSGLSSRMNSRLASLRTELNTLEEQVHEKPGVNSSAQIGLVETAQDSSNSAATQLQQKCQTLQDDLARRQESYIRRERGYRVKIEELQTELDRYRKERTNWMDEDDRLIQLRELHGKVISNIGIVRDRTKVLLQEQEKDLLRAFRARLFDVQSELEREKSKSNDGASVWIAKNRQLERDLEWARQMADRLERVNQTLTKDNSRLKGQFKTQEEDREFLIRQLVAVKKDNTRLKSELVERDDAIAEIRKQLQDEIASRPPPEPVTVTLPAMKQGVLAAVASKQHHTNKISNVQFSDEAEQRYREVVKRLKKLLESERSNLRKIRSQHTKDLQQRTEVETLLRSAIMDVKREIAQKRTNRFLLAKAEELPKPENIREPITTSEGKESVTSSETKQIYSAQDINIEDFNPAWRERTLEILLSQERVIHLLYTNALPEKPGLESYKIRQAESLPPANSDEVAAIYASKNQS